MLRQEEDEVHSHQILQSFLGNDKDFLLYSKEIKKSFEKCKPRELLDQI